jgi:hypothetical protein
MAMPQTHQAICQTLQTAAEEGAAPAVLDHLLDALRALEDQHPEPQDVRQLQPRAPC